MAAVGIDFTFTVDTTDGERELRILSDSLSPDAIDAVLKKYGETHLRERIQARFDTRPGWPERSKKAEARATSSLRLKTIEERSVGRLRRKLRHELVRAKRRLGRLTESATGFDRERDRQAALSASGKRSKAMSQVLKSRMAAVEKRALAVAEFERLAAGGRVDASLQGGKGGSRLVEKLAERLGRARSVEEARRPLGKIASSFVLQVKNGRLVYESEIPWSGVHNEGGTAGHGAKIPPRPFAFLEQVDIDVLVKMILESGMGVLVH